MENAGNTNRLDATKQQRGTLWQTNIAMENGPFIDGLPIKTSDFL